MSDQHLHSRRAAQWRIVWHLLTAAALAALAFHWLPIILPSARLQLVLIAYGPAVYLAAAAFLTARRHWVGRGDWVEDLAVVCASFGLVTILVPTLGFELPSGLTVRAVLGAVVSITLLSLLERFRKVAVGALTLGVALVAAGLVLVVSAADPQHEPQISSLDTSLYSVRATTYQGYLPKTYSGIAGGGMARWGADYLLVTGDGSLHQFGLENDTHAFWVAPVIGDSPMNRPEIEAVVGRTAWIHWFRVLDILTEESDAVSRVYLSHHFWRAAEECFVVRVSMVELEAGDSLQSTDLNWTTVHDTEPCLPLMVETNPGWPFRGMEGGGRMALTDDGKLLLTVGDHGFNGVDFHRDLVQVPEASYGKVVAIDPNQGSWSLVSIGHRNPQGLWVDSDQSIWLTEHGPQGGDELNLIEEGENYGWPVVTYGTDYGNHAWPLNQRQGHHDEFRAPVFAWTPSIGISSFVRSEGALFPEWEGDFLVGSLVAQSLYRVRLLEQRPVLVEPIPIGERIRDLIQDESGRLILWTDSYSMIVLEPTELAFAGCSGCHSVDDGLSHTLGPDLGGILGRRIATAEGFPFSSALSSIDGTWTEAQLDAFLRDPQGFAPGTSMVVPGIEDPQVRRAIINYLRESS